MKTERVDAKAVKIRSNRESEKAGFRLTEIDDMFCYYVFD